MFFKGGGQNDPYPPAPLCLTKFPIIYLKNLGNKFYKKKFARIFLLFWGGGQNFPSPKAYYSQGPLLPGPITPKAHYSQGPLLPRPNIPRAQYSQGPFLPQPITPKVQYS